MLSAVTAVTEAPAQQAPHQAQAPPDPFAPVQLGPVRLRNRFFKAATFEGMARGNAMTPPLIAFHRRIAEGGVGAATLAYCAVSMDGRGAPNEIVMRPEILPGLRKFTDAIRETGAAAAIQLGHAGPVGAGAGAGGLSPSRVFAPQALRFTKAAGAAQLARITNDFAAAAQLACDAGFNIVELHFGHGYLVSAFLSPRMNRRKDEWGGALKNRAKLAREVAKRVREACEGRAAVTAKFNMADGVPGGFWLTEALQVAKWLQADGALHALQLTGGSSFANPMYLFRGEAPIEEMARAFPQPLRAGFKLGAGRFLKNYPYSEAYFLPYARQFRAALTMPLILLGGINQLQSVHNAMAEGFEFVALGRALLREPALIKRWQRGDTREGVCVHCNKCMATIYHPRGTHCVLAEQPFATHHREDAA